MIEAMHIRAQMSEIEDKEVSQLLLYGSENFTALNIAHLAGFFLRRGY